MTTLVICDCGQLAEYDEGLALNCQHCGDRVLSPVTNGNNEEQPEESRFSGKYYAEESDYV